MSEAQIKNTSLADFIWKNAEDLWGNFKHTEFGKIILPFTLLRRLECVLEPTRKQVLESAKSLKESGINIDVLLRQQTGFPFYNLSNYTLASLGGTRMRSMDGGLERARAVGSVRSSYSVLKCGPEVEGRFFGYLLKSSLYIQALRLTTSFIRDGQDMNFSHFRKVRLPRVPMDEQVRIADHIARETTLIDSLIEKTNRSIELLKEKRSALITAAVTGKIDVRKAA